MSTGQLLLRTFVHFAALRTNGVRFDWNQRGQNQWGQEPMGSDSIGMIDVGNKVI